MSVFSTSLLFTLERGGVPEVGLAGQIAVVDGGTLSSLTSEPEVRCPARSTLKPFQFLATGTDPELWQAGLSRYVPALGSVSGTREQVEQIRQWHGDEKARRRTKYLRFAPMLPKDEAHRVQIQLAGGSIDPEHHYCFSKHMAILEACEKRGWPLETYGQEGHPYQTALSQLLSSTLQMEKLSFVVDGCKLLSPVLPLRKLAELYRKLVSAPPDSEMGRVAKLMTEFPQWIAGSQRPDTELMRLNPGRLVAKEGADGLLAIGLFPSTQYPQGLGIVLKVFAGWLPHFSQLALAPLFEKLGLKHEAKVPSGQEIRYHYRPLENPQISVIDISPIVNESIAVWPGDVPFHRKVSMDTEQGHHLTLSSIETTLHVGTHTDSPSHFGKGLPAIDGVELAKYAGVCQVVDVPKARGTTIVPEDLRGVELLARRVIFKTHSYPDPKRFNSDFIALSKEVVEWLGQRGVILVGVDTPSIDPFSSKDLPAHHATARYRMAILEGAILDKVEPGLYDLIAIPLRIEGGDASPVRAVLSPLRGRL